MARGRKPAAARSIRPDADSPAFFENRIRPLLIARCVKCHGPKKAEGGLRLDSQRAATADVWSFPEIRSGVL